MGACTSKSEVLKNISGEDFPVEKEEEVLVKDASVVDDSEAKRQSLDNLLNQNDEEKVSAEKPSSEQENVKPHELEPPVNADEAEVVLKNKASEENNVLEAEQVTKAETSEENNVVAEEAEVIKTETPPGSKEAEEKNDKTEVESETSEANKTEEKKEDAKPLFKLWF